MEFLIVDKKFISRSDTYNKNIGGNIPPNQKGRIVSKETRNRLSKSLIGTKHTIQTKQNMSKAKSGVKRKPFNKETKDKLSISQIGNKNSMFSGYYITPFGKFASRYDIPNLISTPTGSNWCKNSQKRITSRMICKSDYLKSLKESPLDKTFKDLGFDFISK